MTERYSNFLLKIRALSNLSAIYSDTDVEIWDINGRQELNAAGRGSFKLYASNAALLSAVESNIGQVATVYVTDQVAAGANMDLATFIIKNIDTETDEGVSIITVSGPEITDQLRNTDAGDNAIDNGAGGPSTTDISDIMAYASAGWSLTGATATVAGTYHASRGDTVLKLLNAAAQQSGEIFRLATYADPTSKGLFWTASPDASGVVLAMPSTYDQYHGSTNIGVLYSLRREYDFEPVITSIRPYGAGVGGGRLDITGIDSGDTGADPAWLDTTFASNLMENSDLLTALGYPIQQDIDFSWIQANDPTNATQLVSAAVAIWKTGKNFLEQNDAAREFYTALCNVPVNLRPGQSVTVNYIEYQGGITGGSQTINIQKSLTVLSVENRFEEGERITTLTLGDKPLPQPTAASWVADVAEKTQDTTRKSDPSTSPGAVSTSRTLNATLPLRIDGGASGDLSADRTFSLDGLTSYGAANQVAGVNAAATGWEYKTLTEGTGITIGHSAGAITITNSSPGGTDISNLAYVTIGNTGSLSAERALTEGDGIDIADGGANSTVTLSVDVTDFIGNGLVEVATNNVALGTPGSLTASSTNAVTASSHTHEADSTIARSQISITAGAGLTGGGNLTANRTIDVGEGDGIDVAADSIAVDVTDIIGNGLVEVATNNIALGTPGSTTASSTNAVTASSHTHEADSTLARSQISITAGNGLTGGGNLTANRTITMGTPSTLTVTTTNAVTTTSHTHAITSSSAVSTATAVLLATDANGRVRVQGAGVGTAATGTGVLNVSSKIYINETADSFVTTGLVIKQGTADAAISLKNSAMVHDVANFAEIDTYTQIEMFSNVEGGVRQWGFSEGNVGINLRAVAGSGTAVKSAAAIGPILLQAEINDGTGGTTTLAAGGATRNAVVIRDRGNAVAIFAVDGDLYLDTVVNENNWDAHDDIALLHGLRADMMPDGHELRQRFGQFIEGSREILERTGVVHYNDDGHHFVALKQLQWLTIDAVRQMYEQLDGRLAALEATNGIDN